MGIVTWLILGAIAGVGAKWLLPGRDPGGIIVTILIGIGGAFLGGYLGTRWGIGSVSGFDPVSILLSLGGALALLIPARILFGSGDRRR